MGPNLSIGMLLSLTDKISGPLKKVVESVSGIGDAAERSARGFTRLSNQLDKIAKDAKKLDAIGRPLAAIGAAGAAGIGLTIAAFSDLEEAQNRLKTNLMDATGAVGPEFEKLNMLAEKLGTDLPGSTKDMVEMFTALREQGVQTNMILGGYGEAAAKFATVMKLPFAEAATHVAKFSESMGVADGDALAFMDTLQRLKGASGIETGDLAYTFKYAGGALKLLNLQGIEAAKSFSTVIGMMATAGIEGSTAGTTIAQALSKMAEIGHKLDQPKIHKMIGPILDKYSLKLNFFDKQGQFQGLREMVGELEKLKKLNPQEQIIVLKKLFGDEAARPMAVLLKSGVAGYDAMLKRMQSQADMQKKINTIMSGTKMQWETMTGTAANLVANIGGMFAKLVDMPAIFSKLNGMLGGMNEWILANPKVAGMIGGVVAALTALALVSGTFLMGIAAVGAAVGPFLGGMAALARIISVVTGVFRVLSLAMLTNPIGLTITGIAVAALLIYKYWGPITKFFTGIWQAVVDVAGKMKAAGSNIITSLVEGMKSMAMKPVEMIKAIVQKVRNFLPFSPAKEGPLRDIHKIRLIETIAGSMKPGPMVQAMRTAAAATMIVAAPMTAGAAGNSGGGGSVIHYAPVINLAPGTPSEVRQQVDQAIAASRSEFERMFDKMMAQKQRRAF